MYYVHDVPNNDEIIKRARVYLRVANIALFSFLGITVLGVVGFISAAFIGSMEMFLMLIAGTMLTATLATLLLTFKDSVKSDLEKANYREERRLSRNLMRKVNH